MLPIVIPEGLIRPFNYWHEGIRVGMTYHNELYVQLEIYSLEARSEAYEQGFRLAAKGKQVCITVADQGYTLWQNLRTLPVEGEGVSQDISAHRVARAYTETALSSLRKTDANLRTMFPASA